MFLENINARIAARTDERKRTMTDLITNICRMYLLGLAVYHLFTGIISFMFPEFAFRWWKALYGCMPRDRGQALISCRPWGALAFFAGVTGAYAACDPVRYRGVVIGLCVLLASRIAYRIMLREELLTVAGIRPRRNVISISIILIGLSIMAGWLCFDGRQPL